MNEMTPLARLARWLVEDRASLGIPAQVTVRTSESAHGALTVVEINHRLSCPLDGHEGWRISTKRAFLPAAHFSSQARFRLKTAAHDRGRTIYCHEIGVGEVVAGLSYHIDDRQAMPVLVTGIGLRDDTDDNAFLVYRTMAGALVLKQYVHTVADKIGRGGHVDLDLAAAEREEFVGKLGFQRAPKVKGFRPGGLHLRQPAPDN